MWPHDRCLGHLIGLHFGSATSAFFASAFGISVPHFRRVGHLIGCYFCSASAFLTSTIAVGLFRFRCHRSLGTNI